MARIVRFHQTGGPEVLRIEEVAPSPPGEGEVRIAVKAIGLNRAESLFRQGMYLEAPNLPSRLGYEAAGTVEAVGAGSPASRSGTASTRFRLFHGEVRRLWRFRRRPVRRHFFAPGKSLVRGRRLHLGSIPDRLRRPHRARGTPEGTTRADHAASSSVGYSTIQVVRAAGGISIATTRETGKSGDAAQGGADSRHRHRKEDLAARVMEITEGRGADLIFDAVAGPSMEALAAAAAREATIFVYGLLGMQPTPFPLIVALQKGLSLRGTPCSRSFRCRSAWNGRGNISSTG